MEKIKKFFSNKLYLGLSIGVAVLLVAGIVLAIVLGGNSGNTNTPVATLTGCTVEVKSEGGKALENVGVYVYKDAAKTDMLTYVKTDANGIATLDVAVESGSIVVLDKVPAGYAYEEAYTITEKETKITLKTQLLSEMTQVKQGDVMFDFTITAVDGTEYTLSKLLGEKMAVVLNFWYVNCDPCKAEFPFLEQAFQTYGNDVAVLALNPEGDKADAIKTFAQENGLTIPMFEADASWKEAFGIQAYPMTVIIDRFGAIALTHTGGIDSAKTFEDAFGHFVAEDYAQTVVDDIKSLEQEEPEADGSEQYPFSFDGVTEFEVTVPAGGEVYCDVYKVSGLQLKIEDAAARLIYDNNAYHPEEGVIAVTIADQGPFNPAKLTIGNTSQEEKTFKVTFAAVPGSMNDPYPLLFGDLTVNVAEGNSQGVYYLLESEEDGVLSMKCISAPEGIEYNFSLDNLTTSQQVSFLDGEEDIIEMEVKAGEKVRLCVSTFPNSENVYPAAEFKFNIAFGDGKQEEQTQPEETQKPTEQDQPQKPTDPIPTLPDTNGILVNADAPIDQFGFNDFSIEVGKGEKYLVNMMRIFNEATLCISDKDAYVVYKNKTYTPDASGNIYVRIKGQGTFTPTELEIGNSGASKKTFNVKFYFDKGTRENPGELKTGTNVIECKKGNDQGTFYTFKASKSGTLTITVKGIDPSKYKANVSVSDMQAEPTVVELQEDSNVLSIKLPAGATAEIIFSVIDPNKEWNIPAADITIDVAFK